MQGFRPYAARLVVVGIAILATVPAVARPQGMSDANILAHLAKSDSLEIALARAEVGGGGGRTQDAKVRALANMLISDHTQSLEAGASVAQKAGITPSLAPGDTAAAAMTRMMQIQQAGAGDRDFARQQVMLHQHMLNDLNTFRVATKNPAVRQFLDRVMQTVLVHLDRAQALAGGQGKP